MTLWENSSTTISENAWSTQTYDVSALADGNPAFRLRFSMGTTDSAWRYCGWNLDDLHISVTASVPPDSPVLTIQKAGPDIELSWPAMAGSASYWIERDPRLDTPFTLLLATSATGHTLSGEAGTTGCWLYRVIAIH